MMKNMIITLRRRRFYQRNKFLVGRVAEFILPDVVCYILPHSLALHDVSLLLAWENKVGYLVKHTRWTDFQVGHQI